MKILESCWELRLKKDLLSLSGCCSGIQTSDRQPNRLSIIRSLPDITWQVGLAAVPRIYETRGRTAHFIHNLNHPETFTKNTSDQLEHNLCKITTIMRIERNRPYSHHSDPWIDLLTNVLSHRMIMREATQFSDRLL